MLSGCWRLERSQRMNFAQIRDLLEQAIRSPSKLHLSVNSGRGGAVTTTTAIGANSPTSFRDATLTSQQKQQIGSPLPTKKMGQVNSTTAQCYSPLATHSTTTNNPSTVVNNNNSQHPPPQPTRPNPYSYYQQQQQQQTNMTTPTTHHADSPYTTTNETQDIASYSVQQWLTSLTLQQYAPLFTQADLLTIGDLFESALLRPHLSTLLNVQSQISSTEQSDAQQNMMNSEISARAVEGLNQGLNQLGISSQKHRRQLISSLQLIVNTVVSGSINAANSAANNVGYDSAISAANQNQYQQGFQGENQVVQNNNSLYNHQQLHNQNSQQPPTVKQMNLSKESAVHVIM